MMGGNVYAFAGGKGGVGKTTLAANVGALLEEMGHDVALVDADVGMTNLGELLNIRQDVGIHAALAGSATVDEVAIEGPVGLTVVPGERGIDAVGDADPSNLRDIVSPLTERHDIVLLDTGAGLNHQNIVAYGLADAVVLVTTQDGLSVTDTDRTKQTIDRIDGTIAGTVVTRVDTERTDPKRLSRTLDTDLLGLIPEYEQRVSEPHVRSAPESTATVEYKRLATAISVYHKTGDTETAISETRPDKTPESASEPDEEGETGIDLSGDETTEKNRSRGVLGRLTTAVTER
jgi:septum site-determining protein MinD